MGIPLVPFSVTVGFFVLCSVYFTYWLLLILPGVLVVMRETTKSDDQKFRLLYLKALFRLRPCLTGSLGFWNATSYSPLRFKARKP
jgi:type IV secretion system protein VirB3